jgi:hypothetical protein
MLIVTIKSSQFLEVLKRWQLMLRKIVEVIHIHISNMSTIYSHDLGKRRSHGSDYEDECLLGCCVMMQAVGTSDTSINFHKTTRRNIQEDSHSYFTFITNKANELNNTEATGNGHIGLVCVIPNFGFPEIKISNLDVKAGSQRRFTALSSSNSMLTL